MNRLASDATAMKSRLLAEGIGITATAAAQLEAATEGRSLTPADYASTTGLILRLAGDVWVNAPISMHNPNFVGAPALVLDHADDTFVIRGDGMSCEAQFWLPPAYHDSARSEIGSLTNYVVSHGDRVRMSPLRGCAMRCKFCNIPYEDSYATKPVEHLLHAVQVALDDPVQPAQHILISGGTPIPSDHEYLKDVYRRTLRRFAAYDVDIMMVPVDGLLDLAELAGLGLHGLSINLEVFNDDVAKSLMPHKARYGTAHYLRFIEHAAALLGEGRVRSMLMVGIESEEDTLAGVAAILDSGGVPVLSPFRPDPATPLSARRPMGATAMARLLDHAHDLARRKGGHLGPACPPCTHNTLTPSSEADLYQYAVPRLV